MQLYLSYVVSCNIISDESRFTNYISHKYAMFAQKLRY